MRKYTKTKIIILITVGILFALSPILNNSLNFNRGNSEDSNLDNKNIKISAVSGKIHIDNNWTDAKAAEICTGNGTYSEPYIIEDLVIDSGGSGSGILIENSEVFFKIENCTIYNSRGPMGEIYGGILLYNVNNSQLIDNNCSSNYCGIFLKYCNNNTLSGNTANNNYYGIFLYKSDYNNVSGNTANYNDGEGIKLYPGLFSGSDYNTISGNNANNNRDGISLYSSIYNNVSGNTANNNSREGIFLYKSDYNNVSGNTANNNYFGIYLGTSDYNIVSGNTANNNNYGIFLGTSDYNIVSGNTLIGNDECITEVNCQGNKFSDNGDCTYGQGDGGIPFELVILISSISGGAVIGVATLLLIRRKRKRIQ
ncbi:hypothetical protein ES703_37753 [subsurface metagenome]